MAHQVSAVPVSALRNKYGQTQIFLIEDNNALAQNVDLGIREGRWVEINPPLADGTEIVNSGLESLRDGAMLLASIIIFLFIGRVKVALVAVISMPLSYGITFALMKATGTSFDMVTLSAVILAVGMVVDASVVVIESACRPNRARAWSRAKTSP